MHHECRFLVSFSRKVSWYWCVKVRNKRSWKKGGGETVRGCAAMCCCLTRGFLGRAEMISESHSVNSTHPSPHNTACTSWHTSTQAQTQTQTHTHTEEQPKHSSSCFILNSKEFILIQRQGSASTKHSVYKLFFTQCNCLEFDLRRHINTETQSSRPTTRADCNNATVQSLKQPNKQFSLHTFSRDCGRKWQLFHSTSIPPTVITGSNPQPSSTTL